MNGERDRERKRGEKERVGSEFFTHNVKLLITALEHQHGESGPADCDLGSAALCWCVKLGAYKRKSIFTHVFSCPGIKGVSP